MPRHAAIIALALLLAAPAAAEDLTVVPSVCARLTGETGGTISLSSGCQSSSFRLVPGEPGIEVMADRATIRVTGSFRYEAPASGIATMDCGGGATREIAAPALSRRLWRVMHESGPLGTLDLAESAEACAEPAVREGFDPARDAADWAAVDEGDWGRRTARSALGLLPPMVLAHPETIEGAPALDLGLGRSPVRGPEGEARIEIRAGMDGLLDDSLRAIRFVALARPHPRGWVLDGLWRQNLCARGAPAGRWQAAPCP